MKHYWEQLKPQERRWAAGGGVLLFLLLNWFFVFPYFHAWGRDEARMKNAIGTNNLYSAEVRHKNEYIIKIRELQSEDAEIPVEDQAVDFIRFFNSRAVDNNVQLVTQGALTTRTNEFFLEQVMGIRVQANEANLVNFLYSLGAGNSMMRVRAMSLHPEPSHQQLDASITLVASYRKKAPAGSGKSASAKPVAAAPAPAPVKPPADTPKPQPFMPPPSGPGGKPPGTSFKFQAPSATNKPGPSLIKRP